MAKQQNSGGAVKTVEALARPVVEGMGLRLWDVRCEKEGPDWFLRILIDRDESAGHRHLRGRFPRDRIRCWTRQTPLSRATTSKSAARDWAAV